MKQKICIFLLSLLIFNTSFSQKTIRDYWDYKKTKIKEEVQMNAMGLGHGFYRSYYYRGGFKETGFFTNGKKTGLWSQYREGATKPWYQSNMIYAKGTDGYGHQYKIMEKYWYEDGPDAGKLKEWREWSSEENDENGYLLLLKEVIYANFRSGWDNVKYHMQQDYDIQRNLPVEKRYKKLYYPNGKVEYQWRFAKGSGEIYNRIETSYDEDGKLTEKIIRNENDEIISTNGVSPTDERDTYIVNKKTYLFSDMDMMDMIKDTLISIKEGTLLTINDNDQLSPYYGNRLTYTFRVTYQGKTGYVDKNKLTFVSDNKSLNPTLPVETDKYMVDETTYLFREPDLFSDTLIEVEKGTVLITKNVESKDFKKVSYKGITGYIYSLTLSPISK